LIGGYGRNAAEKKLFCGKEWRKEEKKEKKKKKKDEMYL